jgi:hypothetical protein
MTLRRYEYYPASPQAIRTEVSRARTAASNIRAVITHVETEHRKAVSVTDGELAGTMRASFIGPKSNASQVNRQALWARRNSRCSPMRSRRTTGTAPTRCQSSG